MCICLDFLKPKTRINEKVGNKMRLAEPKTQLFKKSCVLSSGKIHVQSALHLWTSEVHKWKRAARRFWIITVRRCIYENVPNISHTDSQSHQFSHTDPSHLFALHVARPHPHASQPRLISALCSTLYSMVSFFLFFFLSSSSSTRFWSSFFFFLNFISV